jgi:hypothetical protein
MRSLRWVVPFVLLLVCAAPARAVPPGWSQGASLALGRDWHTATLLGDGSVLVAGGYALPISPTATAERYFPAANSWQPAGTMLSARRRHVAALLPNGKVLVAGGENSASTPIGSAELYDPATNSWSGVPSMTPRADATATLLPNGKVMVAGGTVGGTTATSVVELFDYRNNSWSTGNPLPVPHGGHAATALPNGDVLITGGYTSGGAITPQTDRYNAATGTWTTLRAMGTKRVYHEATLLADGRVLASGGGDGSVNLATAEVYSPRTDVWTPTGAMERRHLVHAASLLPSGRVLVTGGDNATGPEQGTEIYDPATNAWSPAGNLAFPRHGQASTLLPNGRVLISGGWTGSGYPPSAELYTSPTTLIADPAVSFDDLTPGAAGGAVAHVTNTGDSPLLPGAFALGGSFPGDYAVTGDGCTGATIPPGGHCDIALRFAPIAVGVRGATLTFEANTPSVTHAISLIGRGVPGAPAPVQQAAVLQKIVVTLAYHYGNVTSKSTRLSGLVVKGVPAGSTVTVTCRKGCLKKKLVKRNVRGNVKLKGIVSAKKKVKVGTAIVVTVAKPGMIAAVKTLTVRKRKVPQVTTRCQAPGQARPGRCPA